MNGLRLRACAKINLGLEVLRKRDDGYHDINSLFIAIDLHDEISIQPADGIEVVCEPAVTDRPNDNLAARAAHTLGSLPSAHGQGAKITVAKQIPTGGGLGGGSSDAATTLVGLNRFWNFPADDVTLRTMAASLGSDVPFFLHPSVALVQGRGDAITRLDIDLPFVVVLVVPGIHVSTPWAYSTLGITGEQRATDLMRSLRQSIDDHHDMPRRFRNDFEPVVFAQHPVLSSIKQQLYEEGAVYASMSGSGSTMYGLYTDVDKARTAASAFGNMAVYICSPVNDSFVTSQ